jgi:hypothetical protein
MKIINSHYIPLPEPHWLIVDPKASIYEQIGTLTVVEEAPKAKGQYGIVTHSHPVVAFADCEKAEDNGENIEYWGSLTMADGKVLDDVVIEDCTRLCPSNRRSLVGMMFNVLVFKFLKGIYFENFYLEDFIEDLKFAGIKLLLPEADQQEIKLTTYEGDENGNGIGMILSDMSGIFFMTPYSAMADKHGVHPNWDEIFMEIVNQARAYLTINPHYMFHFSSSVDSLQPLVEKLNADLNDYLERKER